jgi:hypothetical protein
MRATSMLTSPFGSFLGPLMREHVVLMQAMGYLYTTQEKRLLRLDRFLQGRSDLAAAPLPVLIREWAKTRSGPQQALECHLTGRTLFRALSRINPTVENIPWEKRIKQEAHRRHRRRIHFQRRRDPGSIENGAQLSISAITITTTNSAHDASAGLLCWSSHQRSCAVGCE